MEGKITKLQTATDEAETLVQQHKKVLEYACTRVDAAKALLRQLDPEEQAKIQVNDTQLPEFLDLKAVAQEQYETSRKRFETNKRYLDSMKEKARSS